MLRVQGVLGQGLSEDGALPAGGGSYALERSHGCSLRGQGAMVRPLAERSVRGRWHLTRSLDHKASPLPLALHTQLSAESRSGVCRGTRTSPSPHSYSAAPAPQPFPVGCSRASLLPLALKPHSALEI